jgi:hypothetical protein
VDSPFLYKIQMMQANFQVICFGCVPSLKMNMMAGSSLWPTLSPQWSDSADKKSLAKHQSLSNSGL